MKLKSPSLLRLALLIPLALAGSSCSDSSPTRPETDPQPSSIVFSDSSNALADHRATIIRLLEETLQRASGEVSVGGVRITVFADAGRAIPGWGIGGFAPSGSEIEIAVDPDFAGLEGVLEERLSNIAAHELHHAARWRGPGYGMTLLESMVSEGLADHFALELLGGENPPWTEAFPESQTDFYLARARPLLDSTAFNFDDWFFGPSVDLPRWTGYTLGYRLVRDYQDRNPNRSAASLVNTPAEEFRPSS